jgi:hypothetical protein
LRISIQGSEYEMTAPADRHPPLPALAFTLLLSLLSACGGGGGGGPSGSQLISITVTPATPHITAGLTQQLKATGTYSDSSTNDLTDTVSWSSASPTNATVNAKSGLVTAIAVGSANITATLDSVSGSTTVTTTPPAQGWALAASPLTPRFNGFTVTLLANGTVLMAGGAALSNNGAVESSLSSAEIYNPVTGTWTATGSMTVARENHTATLLPDGTVLVAGGQTCPSTICDYSSTVQASAEIYNPATGSWSATGSMVTASFNRLAMPLPNGTVLVADGYTDCVMGYCGIMLAEIYDPNAGTWSATGSSLYADPLVTTALPDGTVLALGGYSSGFYGATVVAEIYNSGSGTWSSAAVPGNIPSSATLLPDGTVLAAGGYVPCGEVDCVVDGAQLYAASTGIWAPTGGMVYGRVNFTATLLANGTVLAAGGVGCAGASCFEAFSPLASAEIYDPASGVWTPTASMLQPLSGQTATLLGNGTVLVIGGVISSTGNGVNTVSAEIYYP